MKIKSLILGSLLVAAGLTMSGCSSNQLGTPTNTKEIGTQTGPSADNIDYIL